MHPVDLWAAPQFQLSLLAAGIFIADSRIGRLSAGATGAALSARWERSWHSSDASAWSSAASKTPASAARPASTTARWGPFPRWRAGHHQATLSASSASTARTARPKRTTTTTFGLTWLPTRAPSARSISPAGGRCRHSAAAPSTAVAAATMLTRSQHHTEAHPSAPGAITRGSDGKPVMMKEDQFRDLCLRCGECMKACITGGIQPALHEAGMGRRLHPRPQAQRRLVRARVHGLRRCLSRPAPCARSSPTKRRPKS